MKPITRRVFLQRTGHVSLGASAAAIVFTSWKSLHAAAANNKVVFGLIGSGGRGSGLAQGFASRGNVEFAWVCDTDPRRWEGIARHLERQQGRAPQTTTDFRRVLDARDVDVVIVGTPDHWHAPATIQACQAGKHVYVEKSPTHCIWEGRKMVEAARKYRRLVQVGTQTRSGAYAKAAREYIQSGKLGKVHLCKVYNLKSGAPFKLPPPGAKPEGLDFDRWLGPAPDRPFNEGWLRGWYYFHDFCGGDTGNDGIHQIDLARFLIGKDYPKAAQASGGKLAYPESDGDVHDTQVASFEFDDLLMTFELTQWAPYMDKIAQDVRDGDLFPYWPQCATRIEIYGTKGLMFVGRHGGGWQVFAGAQTQSRPGELVAQHLGRVCDTEHQMNFLNAIRQGELLNADIEEGHRSAVLEHLANIATRLGGRRLVFDAKKETIVGDMEANAMVKKTYRAGYEVRETV
jgi:predicted dehydrogenase